MIAEVVVAGAWGSFGIAVLVFGFLPGAALRLIVLMLPKDDGRRQELVSELYEYERWERPFWVAEQLETCFFEGVPLRIKARKARRQKARRAGEDPSGWQTLDTWVKTAFQDRRVFRSAVRSSLLMTSMVLGATAAWSAWQGDPSVILGLVGGVLGVASAVLTLSTAVALRRSKKRQRLVKELERRMQRQHRGNS